MSHYGVLFRIEFQITGYDLVCILNQQKIISRLLLLSSFYIFQTFVRTSEFFSDLLFVMCLDFEIELH